MFYVRNVLLALPCEYVDCNVLISATPVTCNLFELRSDA